FAMLREVQPQLLFLRADPQTDGLFHEEIKNDRSQEGEDHGGQDRLDLYPQLRRVAGEEPVMPVDRLDRPETGGDGPEGPAHTVYPESVQRIVITELDLHLDGQVTKAADQQTYPQGSRHVHETAGRGDGDQPRDRAGSGAQGRGFSAVEELD